MSAPMVIKLSGKHLDHEAALTELFAAIGRTGRPAVIVHGGGVEVDAVLSALKFTVEKKNGLRISPREQMPYITAVLAGMCNRSLQARALACGLKAQGLLVTDGGSTTVRPLDAQYGQVGSVDPADPGFLNYLFAVGVTPIVCSIGIHEGQLYNINADDAAAALAVLLHAPLHLLSDVPGVLDADGQPLERINSQTADELIARGIIRDGMAVKIRAALATSQQSQAMVCIGALTPTVPLDQLLVSGTSGTIISASA